MQIDYLSLKNFRNYARLDIAIPTGAVVIHGANAQGKTSLLEAIYYLATSSSPYTNADRQLINWQVEDDVMPFAQVGADVMTIDQRLTRIDITLIKEQATDGNLRFRKDLRINGVNKRRSDLLGLIAVVMFMPQDMRLVEGSPSERRRYLDMALAQTRPRYDDALTDFDKTLTQRNALLKRVAANYADPAELAYWDTQLAEAAGIIIAARQQFIRELEGLARDRHREISGGQEELRLVYEASFKPSASGDGQQSFDVLGLDPHREMPAAEIAEQYRAALEASRREEIERGMTLIGPQRDDMIFLVNGRDLGLYGSRGQGRTAVLAIKLAELQWMHQTLGDWPILLLDEVVAELDAERRAYLLDQVADVKQVLLTTTELAVLTDRFKERAALWEVARGQITVLSQAGAS